MATAVSSNTADPRSFRHIFRTFIRRDFFSDPLLPLGHQGLETLLYDSAGENNHKRPNLVSGHSASLPSESPAAQGQGTFVS